MWVLAPDDLDELPPVPLPAPSSWPRNAEGLVIGLLDPALQIAEVSQGVGGALGYHRGEVVGQPAVSFVHRDDAHVLLTAIARALAERAGVGAELRVRDRDGRWMPMHAMFVPLETDELRIGYSLMPASLPFHGPELDTGTAAAGGGGEDAGRGNRGRLQDLEHRLRRIAGEVASAGLVLGEGGGGEVSRHLPELADLPPRQWEVLDRLARGERVPGIARALFLSQSTVRNHLTAIYRRFDVNSQEELLTLLRARRGNAS